MSSKASTNESNKNAEQVAPKEDMKRAGNLNQNVNTVSNASNKQTIVPEGVSNEQYLTSDRVKFDMPENFFRTPQMFGLHDKPPLGLPNLMNSDFALDMRSPNFGFLNEQFMKPQMIQQRLNPLKEEFGASPPLHNNFSLNEAQDAFAAPRNRKSSFENYFPYLPNTGEDPNSMWKKMDAANSLKYRPPQFPLMGGHGIGNFLNFNGGGYNQAPFMFDDTFGENMRYDLSQLGDFAVGEMRGADPNKKVKKE